MTGEDSIVEAGGVHYWLISVGFILKAILSLFVMALFFAENHQTAKCFIRAQHSCFLASVLALVIAELLILMSISNTGYVTQYPAAFWLIDFAPVGCLWITLEVTSRIYRALPRTRPRATVRKPQEVTFRNTCIAVASYLSPALCRAVHGHIEEDTYFAISSTAMLLTFSSVWGMGGINEAIQASRDAHVIVDPLYFRLRDMSVTVMVFATAGWIFSQILWLLGGESKHSFALFLVFMSLMTTVVAASYVRYATARVMKDKKRMSAHAQKTPQTSTVTFRGSPSLVSSSPRSGRRGTETKRSPVKQRDRLPVRTEEKTPTAKGSVPPAAISLSVFATPDEEELPTRNITSVHASMVSVSESVVQLNNIAVD